MSATDTPGVILTKIFRSFLYQLGIGIDRYQYSMLTLIRQLELDSSYKISSLINGLSNEIFADSITWRVFVKSLIFLGTEKFDIAIRKDSESPETVYTVDISDKKLITALFFPTSSSKEETKLGTHLKKLLQKIVKENALETDISVVADKHVAYLKSTDQYTNKSLKGNLLKELKGRSITWKVFIKALVIYDIIEPSISVTLHDKIGKKRVVSFQIFLDKNMLQ